MYFLKASLRQDYNYVFLLQIMLNSFTELLLPDNRTNSYIFDNDLNKSKSFGQDTFELTRPAETGIVPYIIYKNFSHLCRR